MYIYKITNKINNKIYIGQVYNKTIYDRFERHIKEANPNSKSYLGRAIAKYGSENFICEEIDRANSLKELNEKEIYWIKTLNSTNGNIGYNLTPGGDGGNTYLCKSKEEMGDIKHKISIANTGKNNGMSKQIKALNVNTKEVIHFETCAAACKYFNHKHKESFIVHCNEKGKYLWRKEWVFAYEENDFKYDHLIKEYDSSCRRGTKIALINLDTKEEIIFNSLNKLYLHLNIQRKELKFKGKNECIYDALYKIIKLNKK